MSSLMSMEDLFYGPQEPTWIMPTPGDTPPRLYSEREVVEPPRPLYKPDPPRPVVRYIEPRPAPTVGRDLRPIERLARIHTVPQPVPVRAAHEEIRKVVEVPVPVPVPVEAPSRIVHVPTPAPPTQPITPPIQRAFIHHPIELKVPMCCEKCAKKVKDRLLDLEGVESVVTDQYNQKVIVYGHVDPARVLNRVRLVKKRSAFWDMTVDYSQEFRRFRQAEADAARAASAKAKSQAKAMMATPTVAPTIVVKLPQEQRGPKVTAILPGENENSRNHIQRYVSPPKAYRQELYRDPGVQSRGRYYDVVQGHRQEMSSQQLCNGRHLDRYSVY